MYLTLTGSTILSVVPVGNETEGADGHLHAVSRHYPYVHCVCMCSHLTQRSYHHNSYEHPLALTPRERIDVTVVTQMSGDDYDIFFVLSQQAECDPMRPWVNVDTATRLNLTADTEVSTVRNTWLRLPLAVVRDVAFYYAPLNSLDLIRYCCSVCLTTVCVSQFVSYYLPDYPEVASNSCLRLLVTSNSPAPLAFSFTVDQFGELVRYEVIFAAVILLGVYVLITFDLVHRTLAAAIGAFFTLVRAVTESFLCPFVFFVFLDIFPITATL